VQDAVADIGFIGENVVLEKNKKIEIVEQLGFGKCRLSIAVKKQDNYTGMSFLQNKKIATSYPFLLKNFLNEK